MHRTLSPRSLSTFQLVDGLLAITVGLFIARVSSEQWAQLMGNSWGWGGILLSFILASGGSYWGLQKRRQIIWWPLLLFWGYILFPQYNTTVVFLTIGLTALIWAQSNLKTAVLPAHWTGGLIAGLFFILYIFTLSPGVLPADSGELQWIAARLGVAHPPGFPLYTLLAYGLTLLPGLPSAAYGVNLFSAITSAVTLWLVFQIIFQLTNQQIPALTAVITLGTATTFWAQATTANIRSLTGLFTALMLLTLLNWYQTTRPPDHTTARRSDHSLTLFVLALSFGLTHHASLLFVGFVFGLFVLINDPSFLQHPRRWIRPFFAGLIGLSPLIYLPWRGWTLQQGASVPGATIGLNSWNGFINHVLALGFRGDFFYFLQPAVFTPAILWERLRIMGNVLTFQFHPVLIAGMAFGLILLLRRNWRLGFLLGGSFAIHTFITATYRAPQTVEYMLPAYITAVILLGYATQIPFPPIPSLRPFLTQPKIAHHSSSNHGLPVILLTHLLLITALYQGVTHWPSFRYLHHNNDTQSTIDPILINAPPGSLVLADWHWYTPLRYAQDVAGHRPDLEIRFVFPTDEPYAATWARRINEGLANDRSVVATHFDTDGYLNLPPSYPIGDAFLFTTIPVTTVPPLMSPVNIQLGSGISIRGYNLNTITTPIGAEVTLQLAWQSSAPTTPTPLFIHLIDANGRLVAQDDQTGFPQAQGLTLTQFRLTPRPGTTPGELTVLMGIARAEGPTPLTTMTALPANWKPPTQHPVNQLLSDHTRRLIGYDWDNTLPDQPRLYLHWQIEQYFQTEVLDQMTRYPLPDYFGPWGLPRKNHHLTLNNQQQYVPLGQGIVWMGSNFTDQSFSADGVTSRLAPIFAGSRPVSRDLVISLRLIGYQPDSTQWSWWDLNDSVPAMGAMPSLKWVAGSHIRSPHFVTMDKTAVSGQSIGATIRLYDAFTARPLPILDERITAQYQWIPLGQTVAK